MKVKEITNKNIWEQFLSGCLHKTFFQSWSWGDFRIHVGEKIWRLGIYSEDRLVGISLVAKKVAKRGTYLEVVHGPAILQDDLKRDVLGAVFEHVKTIAKEEHASFIRLNPLWERTEENKTLFRNMGFRQAPMYTSYESTWKRDLIEGDDELLSSMRKTTRYVIRQALKNPDIIVRQSIAKQDVEQFYSLSLAAGERQKFTPFAKRDMETEVSVLQSDNAISLFLGMYRGKAVAAALVVFWSNIAFYHQAASLGEYAKYSVPYLVQWEAMKEAKRRGCTLYDFWGYIDPKKYPKHPWAGPTLFKMGFGGQAFEYIKTQDYPLSWRYWPTVAFETIRKWRRGL